MRHALNTIRLLSHRLSRREVAPSRKHVDSRFAPQCFKEDDVVVFSDFLNTEEGNLLLKDVTNLMRRRRYEKGHWDAVITDYKEVEIPEYGKPPSVQAGVHLDSVIHRTRLHLQQACFDRTMDGAENIEWLPCHAIDLKKEGVLSAHVDSIKFSGGIVAGISLESSSIMRLKPEKVEEENPAPMSDPSSSLRHIDLYLPPLSLYVLSGVARYKYTHELLPTGCRFNFEGEELIVHRDRRVSVVFRDAKNTS